jgi:hypothetical protein
MANTIRIKRRITGSTGAPSSLAVGELAYNEMDNTLYIGTHNNGTPQVVPLAGLGEFVRLSNVNQTINGLKTFSQHPVISETQLGTGENSNKVATTAWVKSLGYSTGAGTVTAVTGTSPVVSSGGTAPAISLASGYGDTQNPYGSKSANLMLASPNGSAGVPTFRAMAEADVPSLTASKISNFDTQVRTSRLDQMAAPTSDVSFNSRKITGLATPTTDSDAANKGYVDSVVQGLHPKQAVRAATTTNIATLSGALTVDGVSLVAGNRVLVKDQTTASQNGIYVVASGAWTRATDADIWDELISAYVFVQEGATNADIGFICTVDSGGTLGTTAVTFAQFTGAGQISAGDGLTQSGTILNVGGTANRITVSADAVDIASTYVGQTSITTLGTIGTGTWNATTIGVGKGGTGVTTLTTNGILYGGATVGATAAGTWDSTNSIGQLLSHNSSGTPVWTDTIDGGTF